MDNETKALLREIRDETQKTNEQIAELKKWALSEIEKERKQSELNDSAVYESQRILPKRDLWGLLMFGIVLGVIYLVNKFL
ncbi:hypothetical protein [uncultured Marinobacter sp.]|uniref:hypothetical protein n=1 Tax=uncultured Marinobacter sp. TaxID=187379 RepID=UPI0026393291|nr:hypothetical protein [uncultured Marinobacter sp.]